MALFNKHILPLILYSISCCTNAYAQEKTYIFKHITEGDGLLSNKVSAMCEDKEGYLWIGSQVGLQRFDGKHFTNYLANVRDTAALQTDRISAVFEDSKGRLWVGTDHGSPYLFDRKTNTFYNYNFHNTQQNEIHGVWHFAEDKQGIIWAATIDGYHKLNEAINTFEAFNTAFGIPNRIRTGAMTIDADNNFWFTSNEGAMFYDNKEKKLYSKDYNPRPNALLDLKVGVANVVINGTFIWATTGFDRAIYQYNMQTNQLKTFSFDAADTHKEKLTVGIAFRAQNGQLMVSLLDKGLAFYNPATDKFDVLTPNNTQPFAFHAANSESFHSFLQTKEGNIMIANEAGIHVFNQTQQHFFTHGKDKEVADFLELDNGDILMGYYTPNDGIVKMDSNFRIKQQYRIKGKNEMGTNQLWLLFRDKKGIIWGPNQIKSILKLNLATGALVQEVDTVLMGNIMDIQQDTGNTVWMGQWRKGLVKYQTDTRKSVFYTNFIGSVPNDIKRAQGLLLDDNKIWVATFQHGLQVFDKQKSVFTEGYLSNVKDHNTISSNNVMALLRYNKDTLLLATEMGLNIFDVKTHQFKALTVREGLPNNHVIGLMLDDNKNLWAVCRAGGFCKINMHNFSITSYTASDGITDNEFGNRIYKLKNGNILVPTFQSFISFNPSELPTTKPPAKVLITGVSVFDKAINLYNQNDAPLVLTYKENSLRIEFSALDFMSGNELKYFYKLEGVDNTWMQSDKNQAAIYNQLNNGNYTFYVRCANSDGVFSDAIARLKIVIQPPFYKTWWFIGAVLASLIGLILYGIRWRERNIRLVEGEKLKVHNINEQFYKARLEALRSQMNPHFIFNSLNAIQECILTNKVDAAYQYLSKFSKLQRMVLSNSEKEFIPLSNELEMLLLYLSLESLRFSQSFSYTINVDKNIDTDDIDIPSMLIQPYVENALWHGLRTKTGDKVLIINYEQKEEQLIITIDDNGIGRAKAADIKAQKLGTPTESKGTILSEQRLHILSLKYKAQINIDVIDKVNDKKEAMGTSVIIKLPFDMGI